jgi:drug/metabolite transporter (DMT)-like permease
MKSVTYIICCLLATTFVGTGTDAFIAQPNNISPKAPQQQRCSRRIKSSGLSLPLQQNALLMSSKTDDSNEVVDDVIQQKSSSTPQSPSSSSILSKFYTMSITKKNETTSAATEQLFLQMQQDALSNDKNTSNKNSLLPLWAEPIAWRAVIVALCALWASNFAVAKLVMAEPGVDSSLYACSRFGVAALALAPFALRAVQQNTKQQQEEDGIIVMDWDILKDAVICGSWVAFGYIGQTLGLITTTSSKSCVICSMHCVFVAIVAEIWRVQKCSEEKFCTLDNPVNKFDVKQLLPAAVAVLGVAIVELKGAGGSPTIGDALSFAQPIGFGTGYLLLEKLMAKRPEAALPVSAIKLTTVAVASLILFEVSPLINGGSINDLAFRIPDFSPILSSSVATGGILYTGLITTALALWVESVTFAKVPAKDASLILTTEPLFAAGCGAVALGETFGTSDYVGASLIVGACVLSIFLDPPESEKSESPPSTRTPAEAQA